MPKKIVQGSRDDAGFGNELDGGLVIE